MATGGGNLSTITAAAAAAASSSSATTSIAAAGAAERWLLMANSNSSSRNNNALSNSIQQAAASAASASNILPTVGGGVGGGSGSGSGNNSTMFCWPPTQAQAIGHNTTTTSTPQNFGQFMQHHAGPPNVANRMQHQQQQQQQQQHQHMMAAANAASMGTYYGPMMPGFGPMVGNYVDDMRFSSGGDGNHDLSGIACPQKKSANNNNNNATVQIEIQCINHTNPININSPSGMNNVASISCGNFHHHQHHQPHQNQQQQQQQHAHVPPALQQQLPHMFQQQQHPSSQQQQQLQLLPPQHRHYLPYAPMSAAGARNMNDLATISTEKPSQSNFMTFANNNEHVSNVINATTSMPPPQILPSMPGNQPLSFYRGSGCGGNNLGYQPAPPSMPLPPLKHYDQLYYTANNGNNSSSVSNPDNYDTVDVPFMMLDVAGASGNGIGADLMASAVSVAQQQQHLHPPPLGHSSSQPKSHSMPQQQPRLEQFTEITQMAMRGCELAERLAHTHRNRPCFKKIDSLCARMKQDLVRPDSVLANINSQGMAWAVKDFIFVFTRIINAWIIIKGYVYNTPDGLSKVKNALSPEFGESFALWQQATMEFVDNLIKSFVNLDQMVQSQRNAFQKYEMGNNSGVGNNNAQSGAKMSSTAAASGNMSGIGGGGGCNGSGGGGMSACGARKNMNGGGVNAPNDDLLDHETMEYMYKLFSLDSNGATPASSASHVAAAVAATAAVQQQQQQHDQRNGMCGTAEPSALLASMLEHSPSGKSGLGETNNVLSPPSINYLSNVIEDSEETQRQAMEKGTYFKTGLYNPLKKDLMQVSGGNNNIVSSSSSVVSADGISKSNQEPKSIFTQQSIAMSTSAVVLNNSISDNTNNCATAFGTTQPRILNRLPDLMCLDLGTSMNVGGSAVQASAAATCDADRRQYSTYGKAVCAASSVFASTSLEMPSPTMLQPHQQQQSQTTNANKIGDASIDAKLKYLLTKIRSLNEAKYFFAAQFTKNYVPDFQSVVPNYVDLRTIVVKNEIGVYSSVYEVVHDLRQIVYSAHSYLRQRPHNFLSNTIVAFDKELESILRETLFDDYDFGHIVGMPGESVLPPHPIRATATATSASATSSSSTKTPSPSQNGNTAAMTAASLFRN